MKRRGEEVYNYSYIFNIKNDIESVKEQFHKLNKNNYYLFRFLLVLRIQEIEALVSLFRNIAEEELRKPKPHKFHPVYLEFEKKVNSFINDKFYPDYKESINIFVGLENGSISINGKEYKGLYLNADIIEDSSSKKITDNKSDATNKFFGLENSLIKVNNLFNSLYGQNKNFLINISKISEYADFLMNPSLNIATELEKESNVSVSGSSASLGIFMAIIYSEIKKIDPNHEFLSFYRETSFLSDLDSDQLKPVGLLPEKMTQCKLHGFENVVYAEDNGEVIMKAKELELNAIPYRSLMHLLEDKKVSPFYFDILEKRKVAKIYRDRIKRYFEDFSKTIVPKLKNSMTNEFFEIENFVEYLQENSLLNSWHAVLTGETGTGKSYLLFYIFNEFMSCNNQQHIVYVPLGKCKTSIDEFIKNTYKIEISSPVFEEKFFAKPRLILLLDGFNEIDDANNHSNNVRNEIEELSNFKGIQILITFKEAYTSAMGISTKFPKIHNINSFELVELDENQILNYGLENNLVIDKKFILLKIPMYLQMYTLILKGTELFNDVMVNKKIKSSIEILDTYMEVVIKKIHKSKNYQDEEVIEFIIKKVLPSLAFNGKQGTIFTLENFVNTVNNCLQFVEEEKYETEKLFFLNEKLKSFSPLKFLVLLRENKIIKAFYEGEYQFNNEVFFRYFFLTYAKTQEIVFKDIPIIDDIPLLEEEEYKNLQSLRYAKKEYYNSIYLECSSMSMYDFLENVEYDGYQSIIDLASDRKFSIIANAVYFNDVDFIKTVSRKKRNIIKPYKELFPLACGLNSKEILDILLKVDQNFLTATIYSNKLNGFLFATLAGNLEIMQYLISLDFEFLNSTDINGNNSFVLAINSSNFAASKWLYSMNANFLDSIDQNGNNVFIIALNGGNMEIILWLYKLESDFINSTDMNGNNAFIIAINASNINVAKWLLELNPDFINSRDLNGNTAFMISIFHGNIKMIQWLYTMNNSFLYSPNYNGSTPFMVAMCFSTIDIMEFLYNIDESIISVKDYYENTPFLMSLALNVKIDNLKWLYHNKPEVLCTTNPAGEDAFITSLSSSNLELTEWLVDLNPNFLFSKNCYGENAFIIAIRESNLELLKWLYQLNSDFLTSEDSYGENVFIKAVVFSDLEIIKWFYSLDSTFLSSTNRYGENIFVMSSRMYKPELILWLYYLDNSFLYSLDSGGKNMFIVSVIFSTLEISKLIYELNPEFLYSTDGEGDNAFLIFCKMGNKEGAEWIYSLENEFLYTVDNEGNNGFLLAIQKDNQEIVNWIYSLDRSMIYSENYYGNNAFIISLNELNIELTKWIYELNPEFLYTVDDEGYNAFFIFFKLGNIEGLTWLYNIDEDFLYSTDREGNNVLTLAAQSDNEEILQWLNSKLDNKY